jgi:DNA-binding SARP family transcriptional activator
LRELPPRWVEQLEWQDQAAALTIAGHAHHVRGEFRRAEELLARALALFEQADHRLGKVMCLERMAWLAISRGQPLRALTLCESAGPGTSDYDLALEVARRRAAHLAGQPAAWDDLLASLEARQSRLLLARARLYAAAAAGQPVGPVMAEAEARGYGFLRQQDPALWAELEKTPVADTRLEVFCFGGMEVRLDGRSVDQWPRRKAKRALAALALSPRGLDAATLADVLEESGSNAASNVRTVVMALRKLVGGDTYVLSIPDGYRLAPSATVDLWAFDAALEAARTADAEEAARQHQRALELYRGRLLVDGLFAGFFETERRGYERRMLQAAFALQAYHERRGDVRAVEEVLQRAATLAPCDEEPYLALVKLYARQARADRARQVYWDYRRALKAHLGTAPDAAFEQAYQAAMAGVTAPTLR